MAATAGHEASSAESRATPPTASGAPATVIADVIAGRWRLDVHVQPIVDLQRGTVVGYEALSRFPGGVRPDVAFDLAIELGRSAELQAIAVRTALARRADLPPGCFLSLNVDPGDLRDERLLDALLDAVPLTGVVVEITERESFDAAAILEPLDLLRAAGATIAVDDAGAGYAGLQAIAGLAPEMVKVDRSLVRNLHRDPVRRSVVKMLGELASELDAWLLVEGVEELPELDEATRLGIPLGQGYLFGRPASAFGQLPLSLADHIRTTSLGAADVGTVRSLVQRCQLVWDGELADEPIAVRVDPDGRPTEVIVDGLPLGDMLVVQQDEPLRTLAARLGARPQLVSYVAVTRPTGATVGVAATRDLLAALAQTDGVPTPT